MQVFEICEQKMLLKPLQIFVKEAVARNWEVYIRFDPPLSHWRGV